MKKKYKNDNNIKKIKINYFIYMLNKKFIQSPIPYIGSKFRYLN